MNPESNSAEIGSQSTSHGRSKINLVLVLVLVLVTSLTVFYYNKAQVLSQDPNRVNQEKVAELVSKLDKLIELPKGEVPSVALISDTAPLANNPFFAKAQVGDVVFFYTAARQAYLYNPTKNMIIEIASLNIGR